MSIATKIVERAQSQAAQLLLVGKVGVEITAADVEQVLRRNRAKPLRVLIRSEGGSFTEASQIYHRLREHAEQHLVSVTIATAYSAAAWIALAADHRVIASNGTVMIHNVLAELEGRRYTPQQLRETAAHVEALAHVMGDIICERVGLDREQVFELMESEAHLPATRAVELGFAHELTSAIY